MEFYLGGIVSFGGSFAPRSWASCHGQLLPISQNTALFSLIGTIYGGDGRTSMGLPDLRGRAPIGEGTGPGLATIPQGLKFGQDRVTLTTLNMPPHSHTATFIPEGQSQSPLKATATVNANSGSGTESNASGQYWAATKSGLSPLSSYASSSDTTMAADAVTVKLSGHPGGITGGQVNVGVSGSQQPFYNWQPSLGMNYVICMQGLYPSRN